LATLGKTVCGGTNLQNTIPSQPLDGSDLLPLSLAYRQGAGADSRAR
jgi:hypothetical protein